jgi:hypothetical protein
MIQCLEELECQGEGRQSINYSNLNKKQLSKITKETTFFSQ